MRSPYHLINNKCYNLYIAPVKGFFNLFATKRSYEMYAKATIAKHPVHTMLVTLPIGMWVFSLVCDIVLRAGGGVAWGPAAYYAIGIGIIGALCAAVFGLIDLFAIPAQTRARTLGYWHLGLNLSITVLFIVDFYLRTISAPVAVTPFILSIVGIAALLVSGWLGGEMVYIEGVATALKAAEPEVVQEVEKLRRAA
jgi:uncharacterized membrane protein